MAKKENKEKKAKKPRKKRVKKDLDITIDGKNTDVHITRKDGVTDIDIDGKNIDVSIQKDKDGIDVDIKSDGKLKDAIQRIVRVIKGRRG